MGFVLIPEEPRVGTNHAVLHLDPHELAYTVHRLQLLVNSLPLSLPSSPAVPQVKVITPAAAALQHKFGWDLAGLDNPSSVNWAAQLGSSPVESSIQSIQHLMSGLRVASTDSKMPMGNVNTTGFDSLRVSSSLLSKDQAGAGGTAYGDLIGGQMFTRGSAQLDCSSHTDAGGRIVNVSEQQLAKRGLTANFQEPISRSSAEMQASTIGKTKGDQVLVSEELTAWKMRWTTPAAEHNLDRVRAMVYSQSLEGLMEGEDDSGWLLSASRNLLNLWQSTCNDHQTSEATLQLKHSQSIEFVLEDMDIDASAKLLLGAFTDPRDGCPCISVCSLDDETFLNYQGMIRVADKGVSVLEKNARGSLRLLHIASLQPFGGPLGRFLAMAAGVDIFVYDLSVASFNASGTASPKAVWKAHDSPISFMHRSSFACALFTGDYDGYIHLWDMKCRPTAPVQQYLHKDQITGISTINAHMISSCGKDGALKLWDIRSSNVPVVSVVPDGKPMLNMAAIPPHNTISFTTGLGLYSLELDGPILSRLNPLSSAGTCTDMKWNTRTFQLYVSGTNGAICIFGKSS